MKIERINENQIRCTLTKEDLIEHKLKISELAYGTEKAKIFFQDMMAQALDEVGFEADNIPLMIEAIPASPDSIVLIITKVDNPETLTSRFSQLSQGMAHAPQNIHSPADQVSPVALDHDDSESGFLSNVRIYAFQSMDVIIRAARALKGIYNGPNSLYKETDTNDYFLVISKELPQTPEESEPVPFSKICNMLTEYGVQNLSCGSTLAYLEEHCKTILEASALQTLAEL